MSTAPTNKPASESTFLKTQGSFYTPEDLKGIYGEGPIPDYSQIIGNFTLSSYKFPDGSSGIALYNGTTAFHIDNQNNMIFSAGPPSQSGCGGKTVFNSEASIQKTGSISIEVSGRQDDGEISKKETSDGSIEQTKAPAYSLKIYGDCLIECLGGDVALKGDNITLNANSTLNLKSGKDINIQAGEQGGKINLFGGSLNINTSEMSKNISGGEYTTGAGEVGVEQYNKGATTSLSTPGNVIYTVNGDYTVGVTGDYKQIVSGHYGLDVGKDYGKRVVGSGSDLYEGKYKVKVQGGKSISTQKESYLLDIGVSKDADKTSSVYAINSAGKVGMSILKDGFEIDIAKQLSKLEMTEKVFKVNAGKNLGAIELSEKQAFLAFGAKDKVLIEPGKISVTATAIYLN